MLSRLTIMLAPDPDWIGVDATRRLISNRLVKEMGAFEIGQVEAQDGQVVVPLRTDIPGDTIRRIVGGLEGELKARLKSIDAGWPGVPSAKDSPGLSQSVPLRDIPAQTGPSHKYTVWPGQTGYLIVAVFLLAFPLLTRTAQFAPLLILIFVVLLFSQYHQITCDEGGLIIHYWVRGDRVISWGQIRGARIDTPRGTSICNLELVDVALPQLINFRVPSFSSEKATTSDGDILFSTILERANLIYTSGAPPGAVTYSRRS